ncbi:DUF4349 domain-containing protein [Paenibacillus chartarius]|uniref:DUF4349 domain-containing protein n=1 Tax=Paenibacillus chartarius TaxID=747481 RepID=A0ABV6DNE0_9BACL
MGVLQKNGELQRRGLSVNGTGEWKGSLNRIFAAAATGILLLGLLAGCSSGQQDAAAKSSNGASATASVARTEEALPAAADGSAVPAGDAKAASSQTQAAPSQPATAPSSPAPMVPAAGITPPIGAGDTGDAFNRKLIYKANLVMEVQDYGEAQTQLRNLAALSGAFILQFNETSNDLERSGNYTIKVAAAGFTSFLDGLEKISPSLQRSVQGQDVTEEYVDLEARLKAKQAVEARLLAFMEKAQKTEDLVAFSNELSKVQTEIEQIKGRMRYLDQNVTLSTIELRMYQKLKANAVTKTEGKASFGERLQQAWLGSIGFLSDFGQGVLIVLVTIFPVLILIAVVAAIYLYVRKSRARKLQQVRAELRQNAALPDRAQVDGGSPPSEN